MDKLISLEEYNNLARKRWNAFQSSYKNGIACPRCGEELYDTNPSIELTSYPPKKDIHCNNCKYTGYRIS